MARLHQGKGACCSQALVLGRRGMLVQLLHCAEPGRSHTHLASRSMSFSRWHSASKHEGCSAVDRSASSAQAPGSGTCGGSGGGGDVLLCNASPDAALIRRSPRDCAANITEGSCAASPRIAAAAALWHTLARLTRRRCTCRIVNCKLPACEHCRDRNGGARTELVACRAASIAAMPRDRCRYRPKDDRQLTELPAWLAALPPPRSTACRSLARAIACQSGSQCSSSTLPGGHPCISLQVTRYG